MFFFNYRRYRPFGVSSRLCLHLLTFLLHNLKRNEYTTRPIHFSHILHPPVALIIPNLQKNRENPRLRAHFNNPDVVPNSLDFCFAFVQRSRRGSSVLRQFAFVFGGAVETGKFFVFSGGFCQNEHFVVRPEFVARLFNKSEFAGGFSEFVYLRGDASDFRRAVFTYKCIFLRQRKL